MELFEEYRRDVIRKISQLEGSELCGKYLDYEAGEILDEMIKEVCNDYGLHQADHDELEDICHRCTIVQKELETMEMRSIEYEQEEREWEREENQFYNDYFSSLS
jgi:hypothetical protein